MMYQLDGLITGDRLTAGIAAQDAWRDWCSQVHGRLGFEFDAPSYRGVLVRQRTPTYQLIGWTGDAEVAARRAHDIRRDPRGHYELVVPMRGSLHTEHEGEVSLLRPGEMALFPIDAPFTVAHGANAVGLILLVPFERVDHRLGPGTIRGCRTFGNKGLSRASRELVVSLLRERTNLSGNDFDAGCDRVVELFCLARDGEDQPPELSAGAAVVGAVNRYVRDHATNPELSVAAMASAIGWSPRYIQAVLARTGTTPTELIRNERLGLARARLSSPAFATQTIAAIGASVGFTSPSAFSHAYRQRYGNSPREARAELSQCRPEACAHDVVHA